MRDPRVSLYRILMVADNADQEIISLVHRRLAKRYHPDIDPSPEAARRMAEINEAYHVLSNVDRRAAYDAELAKRRDRRTSDTMVRPTSDTMVRRPSDVPFGPAGAPYGPPSGSVINVGRYSGWTLGQIRRHDPAFLEWLASVPAGRQYRDEIETLLRRN